MLRIGFARHRRELISLVLLAMLPATAAASTTRAPSPAACVAAARYAIPPHTIVVEPGSSSALTLPGTRPVEIVIGDGALARWGCHVVLHEIGHAFDAVFMTSSLRSAFRARVVRGRQPWFSSGVAAPVEIFAEVFRLCATVAKPSTRRSGVPRTLSSDEIDAGCEIVERASHLPARRR